MQRSVRKRQESLSEKRAKAGKKGGLSTVARHGVEHMRQIGKQGARVFHSLYSFSPVGTSQFAIVRRETREVVAFLDGMPFEVK